MCGLQWNRNVDSDRKSTTCPYCGGHALIPDLVNNYNVNIGSVHINDSRFSAEITPEMRMWLRAAETTLELGKFEEALKKFRVLCDDIPQEYRVWWGQIRALTREFSTTIRNKTELTDLCGLYDCMMHVIPERDRDEISQRFLKYIQFQDQRLERQIQDLQSKKKQLEQNNARLRGDIKRYQHSDDQTNQASIVVLLSVLTIALLIGIIEGSLLYIGIGLLGTCAYFLYYQPLQQEQAVKREEAKSRLIEELSQKSQSINLELEQIDEELSKLR